MARVEINKIDDKMKHTTIDVMEELSHYFNQASAVREKPPYTHYVSGFTSLIKFNGIPILPPLLTEEEREQMKICRQKALMAETRIRARKHEKLVSTVESIVSNVQERRTPTVSPRDISPLHTYAQSVSNKNSNSLGGSLPNLNVSDPTLAWISSSASDDLLTNKNDTDFVESSESSISVLCSNNVESSPCEEDVSMTELYGKPLFDSPVFVFGRRLQNAVASQSKKDSVQSSGSISTDSELNRTVIARDSELHIEPADNRSCSKCEHDSAQAPVTVSQEAKLMASSAEPKEIKRLGELEDETISSASHSEEDNSQSEAEQKTPQSGHWSEKKDRTSYPSSMVGSDIHSLLGEYRQLPVPVASSVSPNMSRIAYVPDDADATHFPNLNEYVRSLERPLLPKDVDPPSKSSENMPSITASTTLSKYMRESGDTLVNVDQVQTECVDTDTNGDVVVVASRLSNESGDHVISPPKLTRQGSYTLDKPSPALVEALKNSQNSSDHSQEKSVHRRLDYGSMLLRQPEKGQIKQDDKVSRSPSTDSEKEGKEEHLHRYLQQISQVPIVTNGPRWEDMPAEDLHAQAALFEQMRQHLLEQQRHQLASLLAEQEQEQALLQQEVLDLMQRSQSRASQNERQTSREQRLSSGSANQQLHTSVEGVRSRNGRLENPSASFISSGKQKYLSMQQTSTQAPSLDMTGNGVSGVVLHAKPSWWIRVRDIEDNLTPGLHRKLCRLSAVVKGYLTRRLMKTEKVQEQIKVIKDTAEFAINFQSETPIKKGIYSMSDLTLQERVIAQLRAALLEIHEIFFDLSTTEKMAIITQSRELLKERELKLMEQNHSAGKAEYRVSAATKKAMERRQKAQAAEAMLFGPHHPKTSRPHTSSPKKKKLEDVSGPVRRHYQSIISKVVKPIHSISPIKAHPTSRDRSPRPKTAPESGVRQKNAVAAKKNVRRSLYAAGTTSKQRPTATTKPGWK